MDYKELIKELKGFSYWLGQSGPESHDIHPVVCDKAVEAIETLLAERDAAVNELLAFRTCSTCKNSVQNREDTDPCPFRLNCNGQYWQWRGPQKGENNDQAKL